MTLKSKVEKVGSFTKATKFEDKGKALNFKKRMEKETKRLWALIKLNDFYVMPHRVGVKYFKSNLVIC